MSATAEQSPSNSWHGPPPPAELTDDTSSLQLLSQGAEARVWLVTLPASPESHDTNNDDTNGHKQRSLHVGSGIQVPQLLRFTQKPSPLSSSSLTSPLNSSSTKSLKIVCKERFPKKYRHPQLDVSLTKSRTKGEARSLIRCQKADVPCPNVLAIAHWSNKKSETNNESGCSDESKTTASDNTETSTTSYCLFLECVEGCTVRQYFEQRSSTPLNKGAADVGDGGEPTTKRPRCEESNNAFQQEERVTTVIDSQTLCVARTIGTLVAKMHAAGVIHGDLTTSNIMIRNPPCQSSDGGTTTSSESEDVSSSWKPQLVLIDFGLAASTASTTNNKGNNNAASSSNKKAKPFKQQHNAEEKAVDLYVLERAFLSTHPESELLVEEVWKGYRGYFEGLDCEDGSKDAVDGSESDKAASGDGEGGHGHVVVNAVLNRLEQVRMRGRKRECFG